MTTTNQILIEQEIEQILMGAYSEKGIDAWWDRPRGQLDGLTPRQVFAQGESGMEKVLNLARSLNNGGGT